MVSMLVHVGLQSLYSICTGNSVKKENNEQYRKVRDFNFIILLQSVWKNKDPPLIRTEINVGPLILIHVINLTCLLPCNVQGT